MDTEKQLSGEKSLKLINRMIYEARGYYYESGLGGLIYGFSVVICSLLVYMREENIINLPFHPFYLLVPIFFIQGVVQFRENKKKKAKTFTDETIDYVWMGFFISVLATLCAGFAGIQYISISVIILLAGFATFLTGMITKFRYHIIISFACWLEGIISFFMLNNTVYILLAIAALLIWIVPGFILRAHFKKQEHGK